MAAKRAYVAAVICAIAASDLVTQDAEDIESLHESDAEDVEEETEDVDAEAENPKAKTEEDPRRKKLCELVGQDSELVNQWLVSIGWLTVGQTWADLSDERVESILAHPVRFRKAVQAFKGAKGGAK